MVCRKLSSARSLLGLSRNPTASFRFLLMSVPSCSDGRLYDGADEASFQAKASTGRLTGIGSRRDVFDDGGRGRSKRTDSECTIVARQLTASCHHSRRRGNCRRQLGDVLRLRQGKRIPARPRHKTCGTRRRLRQVRRLCSSEVRRRSPVCSSSVRGCSLCSS